MSDNDEADLIGKRGTDEKYEREDMLLQDFRTQIAPDWDGERGSEKWNEPREGGEDGKALGAASMDDVLRAVCSKVYVSIGS